MPLLRSTPRQDDYMMKLDLKDAYYSNPITKQHRKYLHFIFGNVVYEFQCLPFGLSSAPRTFTKVPKPVISLLRKQGLRVIIYIDDLLLAHQDPKELMRTFNEVCQLLSNLGFIVKKEKCSTMPLQSLFFLGALLNSVNMTMAVPPEKLQDLQCEAQALKKRKMCTIQELSSILSRMTHVSKIGMETAPCTTGDCTDSSTSDPFTNIGGWPGESLENLQWWTSPKPVQENSTPIVEPVSNITIQTDASCLGWGAVCQGTKTGGHWNKEEQQAHINILELKAAYLAIQSYLKACQLTESRILLQMDNTTAVAYINKRGGTKSNKLKQLGLEIWNVCQSKKITLISQHLQGIQNTEEDAEWRQINIRIEWTLDK